MLGGGARRLGGSAHLHGLASVAHESESEAWRGASSEGGLFTASAGETEVGGLSLKCRRGAGGSSSPFRHRSAVLRPMAAAPMAQLAKPGRLHVQAGRGGHCWVIVSRLNTVFWPTAEDPLEDLLPGTNIRALNG